MQKPPSKLKFSYTEDEEDTIAEIEASEKEEFRGDLSDSPTSMASSTTATDRSSSPDYEPPSTPTTTASPESTDPAKKKSSHLEKLRTSAEYREEFLARSLRSQLNLLQRHAANVASGDSRSDTGGLIVDVVKSFSGLLELVPVGGSVIAGLVGLGATLLKKTEQDRAMQCATAFNKLVGDTSDTKQFARFNQNISLALARIYSSQLEIGLQGDDLTDHTGTATTAESHTNLESKLLRLVSGEKSFSELSPEDRKSKQIEYHIAKFAESLRNQLCFVALTDDMQKAFDDSPDMAAHNRDAHQFLITHLVGEMIVASEIYAKHSRDSRIKDALYSSDRVLYSNGSNFSRLLDHNSYREASPLDPVQLRRAQELLEHLEDKMTPEDFYISGSSAAMGSASLREGIDRSRSKEVEEKRSAPDPYLAMAEDEERKEESAKLFDDDGSEPSPITSVSKTVRVIDIYTGR